MIYAVKDHVFERAKNFRQNMTGAELLLWEHLKGKKLLGL